MDAQQSFSLSMAQYALGKTGNGRFLVPHGSVWPLRLIHFAGLLHADAISLIIVGPLSFANTNAAEAGPSALC